MNVNPLPLSGAAVVETTPFRDHRGSFARFFCANELAEVLGNRRIVNINHSRTAKTGAIRGLHFQYPPAAEMKLVRCIRGKVWDVAVDLRAGSPTFLKWHAVELTPENALMLVVPEGFAHGFQVLEENSEIMYLVTAFYTPGSEGGIRYDDPLLSIDWPLPATDLSARDEAFKGIGTDFKGIVL